MGFPGLGRVRNGRLTPRRVTVKEKRRKKRNLKMGTVDFDEWKWIETEQEVSE